MTKDYLESNCQDSVMLRSIRNNICSFFTVFVQDVNFGDAMSIDHVLVKCNAYFVTNNFESANFSLSFIFLMSVINTCRSGASFSGHSNQSNLVAYAIFGLSAKCNQNRCNQIRLCTVFEVWNFFVLFLSFIIQVVLIFIALTFNSIMQFSFRLISLELVKQYKKRNKELFA